MLSVLSNHATLYTWDPAGLIISIVAPTMVIPQVIGFAPGSAVQVAPVAARFTRLDGVRGQTGRIRQGTRAGTIAFVLEERSWVNTMLDTLYALDDTIQSGICAIMIADVNGLDLAMAPQAWITGRPGWSKGGGPGTKLWAFDCAILEMFNGGGIPENLRDLGVRQAL